MRLVIDSRCLSVPPTGVGHYLLAAVNVWSQLSPDTEFLLASHKPLHSQAAPLLCRALNVKFLVQPARFMPHNGLWWLLHDFVLMAETLGATHLWGSSGLLPFKVPAGMCRLLTVHDLVWRSLSHTMSGRSRFAYRLLAGRSIRQADQIWAVSRFTADQIHTFYPQRQCQAVIVGSGLNPMRFQQILSSVYLAEIVRRYGVHERTLLFVGTLEPRKNLRFLLSLMPRLAQLNIRLLIVGCSGWQQSDLVSIVQSPGFPRASVCFCGYLSDNELQALYQSAAFFISTALMEGFGLPHLEAMAAGCPVIAADNSAVSEVVREGGWLVKGWEPSEWIKTIQCAFQGREQKVAGLSGNVHRHDLAQTCMAVHRAII